jgi:hypothetical protein
MDIGIISHFSGLDLVQPELELDQNQSLSIIKMIRLVFGWS